MIFSNSLLFSDSYDDAVKYLKNNQTDKSLNLFYKYLDTDTDNQKKIYKTLDNIIRYENNVKKIITTVNKHSDRITDKKKEKSEILLMTAEIAELSGNTEKAVELYLSSYNMYPHLSNSRSLLISARILLDSGEFEKAEKQLKFYKKLPLDNNSIYRAEILESLIKILSGKKASGEKQLSKTIEKKDISAENLSAAVLITHNYNLETITNISKKRLSEKNINISSLLNTGMMISPALFFNYSEINESGIGSIIKKDEKSSIFLQTGSYSSKNNAENMSSRLKNIGFKSEIIKALYKGKTIYKVLIPTKNKSEAQKYHISLKEHSIESFMIFE